MKKSLVIFLLLLLLGAGFAVAKRDALAARVVRAVLDARGLSALGFDGLHVGSDSAEAHHISLPERSLKLATLRVRYTMPDVILQRTQPVSMDAEAFTLREGKVQVAAERLVVDARPEGAAWRGPWQLEGLRVEGAALPLPALSAVGAFHAQEAGLFIEGAVKGGGDTYRADFVFDTLSRSLRLKNVSLPWQGGALAVREMVWPLDDKEQAVRVPVEVRNVPLGALLGMLLGERIAATGTVSGVLQVLVGPGDEIALADGGLLHAVANGVIAMQPDVIPGDNPQVALTRDVLKNFHYKILTLKAGGGKKDGKAVRGVSLQLGLEGNNPDMYNGRAVKLNVNLNGDVLDFLRQNVMLQTDPQSLLKKEAQP